MNAPFPVHAPELILGYIVPHKPILHPITYIATPPKTYTTCPAVRASTPMLLKKRGGGRMVDSIREFSEWIVGRRGA